jgi:hypothetical protein
MGKKLYKEELIYNTINDISNKFGMGDNIFYIRVIRREVVKPCNFFRRREKKVIYYDIEYTRPDTHTLESTDSMLYDLIPSVRYDINRNNKPLIEKNDSIYKLFDNEMWKAENFCLKYKTDNCDYNAIIRKLNIFL